MSIEHVCIVGQVGFTEAEATRGCVDGCATCGAMVEDYLRVDGRLLCPACAARMWTVERETHAELAAERTADVRRMVEELDARARLTKEEDAGGFVSDAERRAAEVEEDRRVEDEAFLLMDRTALPYDEALKIVQRSRRDTEEGA